MRSSRLRLYCLALAYLCSQWAAASSSWRSRVFSWASFMIQRLFATVAKSAQPPSLVVLRRVAHIAYHPAAFTAANVAPDVVFRVQAATTILAAIVVRETVLAVVAIAPGQFPIAFFTNFPCWLNCAHGSHAFGSMNCISAQSKLTLSTPRL
jgi:hypothetical protein